MDVPVLIISSGPGNQDALDPILEAIHRLVDRISEGQDARHCGEDRDLGQVQGLGDVALLAGLLKPAACGLFCLRRGVVLVSHRSPRRSS